MIKIYTGPTGCGKTFQAFNRLKKETKIIYVAPCRQLVYETAMKYGGLSDGVITSDMKMRPDAKRSFRTYECVSFNDLRHTDVFIVDEAHFMMDKDRGAYLCSLIKFADKIGKTVVLLSATMNFTIKNGKYISLPPRGEEFKKERISLDDAIDRARNGVPTLIFHSRRSDCGDIAEFLGIEGVVITADTSVADRVKLVEKFNKGEVTLMEATNAMAQGVNVPCENLINYYNSYDSAEVIIQKFGRLGRTGVTRPGAVLTYCGIDADKANAEIEAEKTNRSINTNDFKYRGPSARAIDYDLRTQVTPKQKRELKHAIRKAQALR